MKPRNIVITLSKLVKEGVYDSTLFHRVIKQFMIQAGDPDSKNASDTAMLGSGDVGYTIPAEFNPKFFHKKGVLAAARQGDDVKPRKGFIGLPVLYCYRTQVHRTAIAGHGEQNKRTA